MLFHVPRQRECSGVVIIHHSQRPRHMDRKKWVSFHSAWTKKRAGGSSVGRQQCLPMACSSSSVRMAPLQNYPGWGPRPQTSFCLAAGGTSAGMVRKVPTVTEAPGSSTVFCLFTLPPSVLDMVSALWSKSGDLGAACTREGIPALSLVLCSSAFIYQTENYPHHLTSASATVWPAVRFSNHGVPHPLCPPKLLLTIIVTP